MDIITTKGLLYDRYIKPTVGNQSNFIGVEIEIPILNLDKQAVDFDVIHSVAEKFIHHFGFSTVGVDDKGNVYSAVLNSKNDIISFDCSYNNLEFSFGKATNLFEIKQRFEDYYSYFQSLLNSHNYTLTGMGVNPYRQYNQNLPIPNGRYRMLFHHLGTYTRYDNGLWFHKFPEYGTFSSASQVQLDVEYEELVDVVNVFSKLEPIKAVLFSNSVMPNEDPNILCWRDIFWEHSTHGINPHNIGMYNCEFKSVDEILNYISTTSIYCVERGDKYINFEPIVFADYLNMNEVEGEYYADGVYKRIKFVPEPSDIEYLRTFKFEDITFRGTVEFRSVCCQPICDSMTVSAFHLGIKNNLKTTKELLNNENVLSGNGYSYTELRKMLIRQPLPSFIDENELYALAKSVVDLAYNGLAKRGYGEEVLLEPLYDRIKQRTNPSKLMLSLQKSGTPIEEIIKKYS